MQALDADRQLAILRGDQPEALPPTASDNEDSKQDTKRRLGPNSGGDRNRRKRKHAGEDDTDFEMRLAREQAEAGARATQELVVASAGRRKGATAPLVDAAGHISLFGSDEKREKRAGKNEEAEREAAKKRREIEDLHQVRFSNAAGRDGIGLTDGGPWYAKAGGDDVDSSKPLTDVWGNADPGRKNRNSSRLVASDPLAMMKSAAARVRELNKERKAETEERQRALVNLQKEERRREKRRRRHGGDDIRDDDLEGFSLDDPRGEHVSNRPDQQSSERHRARARERGESRDDREGRDNKPHRTEHDRHRHRSRHHHHHHHSHSHSHSHRDHRGERERDG
jgi:hypothetical protein